MSVTNKQRCKLSEVNKYIFKKRRLLTFAYGNYNCHFQGNDKYNGYYIS